MDGKGEGRRKGEQRYVLFAQAPNVSVCMDVNNVAGSGQ